MSRQQKQEWQDFPKSKTSRDGAEVKDLRKRWDSLSAREKGAYLKELLPKFSSIRAFAKAISKSEGRIRQLLKVADGAKKSKENHEATKAEVDAHALPSPSPQPEAHSIPVVQNTLQGNNGKPKGDEKSLQQSSGRSDNALTVRPPTQAGVAQIEPEGKEESVEGATAKRRKGLRNGTLVGPTATPGYAMNDVAAAGKLLRDWIRWNFKPDEWHGAVEDVKTAYWLWRQEIRTEARQDGQIPAGLTPEEVIKHCLSNSIKEGLESDTQNARRKWFARWASVLLPDPKMRGAAAETAKELLKEPTPRWLAITYDPRLNHPTCCIRSTGQEVVDVLDTLAEVLCGRPPLGGTQASREDMAEAVRYAAATLREGSPPPLR